MTPGRAVALNGLVGNHVVARLVGEERHAHGPGAVAADPGRPSGEGAENAGAAFAAGARTAPSVGAQRAARNDRSRTVEPATSPGPRDSRAGQPGRTAAEQRALPRPAAGVPATPAPGRAAGGGALVVARVKGKGKAPAAGGAPSWEQRAKAINEIGRKHTCEQPNRSWGRVRDEIVVRYSRSYKHQPDEQSLRHIARALYNAIERQEQRRSRSGGQKTAGMQKVSEPNQEVQVMLYNGHLVITANQDSSLDLLHQWLLNDNDKNGDDKTDVQDAPGDRLRQVLTTDFHADDDTEDSERESEGEAALGKRPARASGPASSKRRRTEGERSAGASSKGEDPDRVYRDQQARLKISEGLRPAGQGHGQEQGQEEEQPGTPMDVDGGPDAQVAPYLRDNRTLRALRGVRHVRKIDVSHDRAEDPAYRQYLAKALSGEAAGYAYLVYNSGSDGVQHAEQKLLMLLNNADITGENAESDVLIRGRKRPCQACLGLQNYFKNEMGLDIRYNDRGNHYFINATTSAVEHFPGQDASRTEAVDGHLKEQLRHGPMYAAAPSGATPAPAFHDEGVHEPTVGAEGGTEQRKRLKKYTTADGRTGRLFPRRANLKAGLDTPSDSEVEDPAAAGKHLETHFHQLSLRDTKETDETAGLESAPDNRAKRSQEQQERWQAWFDEAIVPQLRVAAGPEFWQAVERRSEQRGTFGTIFPDALRRKIRELTQADPGLKTPIRVLLNVSVTTMNLQLGKTGESTRKLAHPLKEVPGADGAIEAAMPARFRSGWRELLRKNEGKKRGDTEKWNPKGDVLTDDFDRALYEIMFEGEHLVSANSVADKLFISQETFKRRVKKMKERYGQDDVGEGPAPR
ncbi:hypothetical protein [Streptomyces spectabilis]|nr:hypothetical protein [Streptomyces spectabilis]MCI3900073.1 hypothetical protein [Streptomyces spectabilis]QEV57696.1 hypothetical protein CP982_02365 [Streptomyces spectabilis]